MSFETLLGSLKKTILFRDTLPEHVSAIASHLELSDFEEGEEIFGEGAPGSHLYIVLEGAVRICKRSPAGVDQLIATIPMDAVFGEIAFLTGASRTASACAAGKTRVAGLSSDRFRDLVTGGDASATSLLLTLAKVLSSRLALMGEELVRLADKEQAGETPNTTEIADLRRRLLTEWNF